MANWVTLANGVHIDLDDPNNPITGNGSFADLGKSGNNSNKSYTRDNLKEKSVKELTEIHQKMAKARGTNNVPSTNKDYLINDIMAFQKFNERDAQRLTNSAKHSDSSIKNMSDAQLRSVTTKAVENYNKSVGLVWNENSERIMKNASREQLVKMLKDVESKTPKQIEQAKARQSKLSDERTASQWRAGHSSGKKAIRS